MERRSLRQSHTGTAFDAMAERLHLLPSRGLDGARLLMVEGMPAPQAAAKLGITHQSIYAVAKKIADGPASPGVCKCCGQNLP